MIIAHRGASAAAPENTLEAFELAWRQNADAIEGDFHLTKDREIVCHHDPGIRGRPISHLNLEEIRDLKPEVPTLGEVLNTVPPGKHSILEIKWRAPWNSSGSAIASTSTTSWCR